MRLLLSLLARIGLVLGVDDFAPEASDVTPPGDDAADGGGDSEGGDPDATAGEGDAAAAKADDRDKLIRKLERRIGTRTRALGEKDAELAFLRRQLAERAAAKEDPEDSSPAPRGQEPAQDVEALANQRAVELRRREKIAERTAGMIDAGKKLDEKFRELALDVANDLPFVDERGEPTEFIEEVLDTDKPAALLLHLARNPDVAESLQGLTGAKLGRKLESIVRELGSAAPKPSNAPKPLEPVGGRGNAAKAETAMTDDEWRAQRLKRKA